MQQYISTNVNSTISLTEKWLFTYLGFGVFFPHISNNIGKTLLFIYLEAAFIPTGNNLSILGLLAKVIVFPISEENVRHFSGRMLQYAHSKMQPPLPRQLQCPWLFLLDFSSCLFVG